MENELTHWGFKKGQERKNHKYVVREATGNSKNPFKYYYSLAEYKARNSVQNTKEKAISKIGEAASKAGDFVSKAPQKAASSINSTYKKAVNAYDKEVNDNIYITDNYTYGDKIKKIKGTDEYKKYVAEGNTEYSDVDEYLYKKKHPIRDLLEDAVTGRDLSVPEVTKDSVVAGLNDYATAYATYVYLGLQGLKIAGKAKQGTYHKQIENGMEEVDSIINDTKNYAKTASDIYENKDKYDAAFKVTDAAKAYANASEKISNNTLTTSDIYDVVKTTYHSLSDAEVQKIVKNIESLDFDLKDEDDVKRLIEFYMRNPK